MSQAGIINIAGSGGGVVETLTGNTGGPVSPTGNNINTVGTGSVTIAGNPGTSTLTTQLTGLTNHNVLIGAGTATITKVAPSATSGVPLISQGASADPIFGTAVVAGGGTGDTSFTAFAPIAGGTTTTGALQSASTGIGTSGFVFTSNGASALPSFQAAPAASVVKLFASVSSTASNVTGNGTPYQIIYDTVLVDSASAYNAGTGVFTAPKTGFYFVSAAVGLNGFNGTHIGPFYSVNLSSGSLLDYGESALQSAGNLAFNVSGLVSMTASQTLNVTVQVNNSTQTVSVAGAGSGIYLTYLTIFQVP